MKAMQYLFHPPHRRNLRYSYGSHGRAPTHEAVGCVGSYLSHHGAKSSALSLSTQPSRFGGRLTQSDTPI